MRGGRGVEDHSHAAGCHSFGAQPVSPSSDFDSQRPIERCCTTDVAIHRVVDLVPSFTVATFGPIGYSTFQ